MSEVNEPEDPPPQQDYQALQAVRAMLTVLHGTWDHAVLIVLRGRRLRQIDIQRRLEQATDGCQSPVGLPRHLSRKVLRETLHRLETAGLVRHDVGERGFPRELWYELTEDGRTILEVARTMGEHAATVLPVLDAVLRRRLGQQGLSFHAG